MPYNPKPLPKRRSTKLTFVSLFSGCGGLDLGFVREGFTCVAAVDVDDAALTVHNLNFDSPAIHLDLASPDFAPPRPWHGVDVVLAGPPCQGFSTVGKRLLDDPRNSLLERAAEIAACLRPKAIVLENVPGVLAGAHKHFWDRARSILQNAGYGMVELMLDARLFGVAQTRRRIVLVALDRGRELSLNIPVIPTRTLRDVLPCVTPPRERYLAGDSLAIAQMIGPGQKLCNVRGGPRAVPTWSIPRVFGNTTQRERALLETIRSLRRRSRMRPDGDADPVTLQTLTTASGSQLHATLESLVQKNYLRLVGRGFDLMHTFNGKYRRLSWDAPAPTVDTRFGSGRYFLHPEEHRGFTVAEAAAVQSFPSSFRFVGPTAKQYRMIGNAVPPALAAFLAGALRGYL